VWCDEDDGNDESADSDNDDSGRLFDFFVAKINDQEENIVARAGFTVRLLVYSSNNYFRFVFRKMGSPLIVNRPPPPKMYIDPKVLAPRLLHGEIMQGFMTARFQRAHTLVETISRDHQSAGQIRVLL
jgi:hypothetical protein